MSLFNPDQQFEKLPDIRKEFAKVGDKKVVVPLNEGKKLSAEEMAKIYEKRGLPYKPVDTVVLMIECDGERYNLWVKSTDITANKALYDIEQAHNGTIVGAVIEMECLAKGNPKVPNFSYKILNDMREAAAEKKPETAKAENVKVEQKGNVTKTVITKGKAKKAKDEVETKENKAVISGDMEAVEI